MATPAVLCSASTYRHLATDAAEGRVGGTTVVFNSAQRALYFSKRIIPYLPSHRVQDVAPVHLHLGLYAYRLSALECYRNAPPSELERLEGLEQLRFLELGLSVSIVPIESMSWDPIELNNPSDVEAIERVLAERGIQ